MVKREDVFNAVLKEIKTTLFYLENEVITGNDSLMEFGANSLDRVDIIMSAMEALGVQCDMMEFKNCDNIDGIVDILYNKLCEGL